MKSALWLSIFLAVAVFAAIPARGHGHHRHHCGYDCGDCIGGCADCGSNSSGCRGSWTRPTGPSRANTSVSGTVAEVSYLPGSEPASAMVEVLIQTGGGESRLRLAPVGYLKDQGLVLREGTAIEARGYRVDGFDGPLVMVTSLKAGETSVDLRDRRGRPLW